ncbi:MAG: hypothetical protein CM15mP84_05020 [Cellvibrionales bacterium]|nr:MAG: hypothetical protein CM15mP84_05020 [Cellvibrionales bacterium]
MNKIWRTHALIILSTVIVYLVSGFMSVSDRDLNSEIVTRWRTGLTGRRSWRGAVNQA